MKIKQRENYTNMELFFPKDSTYNIQDIRERYIII